jgi:hypothetical protein
MGHVVKQLPWCVIDIDTTLGRVFFQQWWKYAWEVQIPMEDWSLAEKRTFHNSVDRQIWASWSNRVRLGVAGTHAFARRFARAGATINLDVRCAARRPLGRDGAEDAAGRVRAQHGRFSQPQDQAQHQHGDVDAPACNAAPTPVCRPLPLSTHEFGHTIDNDDEYTAGSPHLADNTSIEHRPAIRSGTQPTTELNTMIPATFRSPTSAIRPEPMAVMRSGAPRRRLRPLPRRPRRSRGGHLPGAAGWLRLRMGASA